MNEELLRHENELDAAGRRIDVIEQEGDSKAAARLRELHERVRDDFARLRRAFADDWRRIRHDAQAGLRDINREIAEVDRTMIGFHDEQLETLDDWLDDVTRELERLHADDLRQRDERRAVNERGLAELRAQIDLARERRDAVGGAPPSARQAHVDSYAAAVARVRESWQRLKAGRGAQPEEAPRH